MLNKEISKEKLGALKMVVFDSDGVSVPRGTSISQQETEGFNEIQIKVMRVSNEMVNMLQELKKKLRICFSSGRTLLYLQDMYGALLGHGAVLQAENGNISLIDGKIVQHFDYNEDYFKKIANIQQAVRRLPISGIEPKQFILTVHSPEEFQDVYTIVKKYDPQNQLKCMWNGEAFDIMAKDVSKGAGLLKLMTALNIKKQEVIAIGDRINDEELLKTAGIGVSADIEKLKADYWTTGENLGGGVLARYLLEHFDKTHGKTYGEISI